jgi:hypothetical protein
MAIKLWQMKLIGIPQFRGYAAGNIENITIILSICSDDDRSFLFAAQWAWMILDPAKIQLRKGDTYEKDAGCTDYRFIFWDIERRRG